MLGLHQALWTWQGLGGETKRGRDAWDLTRAPRPWIWRGCCGQEQQQPPSSLLELGQEATQ